MNIQKMKVFLKVCGIFCVIILASLVCFPCFNSVSCDFHYLIVCKQAANIFIINILAAIMQYIFIHKKL